MALSCGLCGSERVAPLESAPAPTAHSHVCTYTMRPHMPYAGNQAVLTESYPCPRYQKIRELRVRRDCRVGLPCDRVAAHQSMHRCERQGPPLG